MAEVPAALDRQQVLDWFTGFEATAKLERAERRRLGPQPERAIRILLEMHELSRPTRERFEDRAAQRREREVEERWARLRAASSAR